MKNQNSNFPNITREQIETAQGKQGEMTLIEAVLPLIVTIEGKDFFFFYEADNPKKMLCRLMPERNIYRLAKSNELKTRFKGRIKIKEFIQSQKEKALS